MVIFLNSVDLIFKSDISITNGCIPSSKFISNHLNIVIKQNQTPIHVLLFKNVTLALSQKCDGL